MRLAVRSSQSCWNVTRAVWSKRGQRPGPTSAESAACLRPPKITNQHAAPGCEVSAILCAAHSIGRSRRLLIQQCASGNEGLYRRPQRPEVPGAVKALTGISALIQAPGLAWPAKSIQRHMAQCPPVVQAGACRLIRPGSAANRKEDEFRQSGAQCLVRAVTRYFPAQPAAPSVNSRPNQS